MIVYECDWCGVQANRSMPETWARLKLSEAHDCDELRGDYTICTACAQAFRVFTGERMGLLAAVKMVTKR